MEEYPLSASSVHTFLQRKGKEVPPSGSIVDLGVRETIHLYVYKFDKVTSSSNASADDLKCIVHKRKQIDFPVRLNRNLTWSFFSLQDDINYDLTKEFATPSTGQLHRHYIYHRPDTENDCVETMRDHFKLTQNEIRVTKIVNPGNTDHYCQFSGGGNIYIEKLKESLVIYSGPELSKDGTLTSGGDTESTSIEGDYTHQSLRDQLLANSILACTSTFLKECQMEYDSAFIKDVDTDIRIQRCIHRDGICRLL